MKIYKLSKVGALKNAHDAWPSLVRSNAADTTTTTSERAVLGSMSE